MGSPVGSPKPLQSDDPWTFRRIATGHEWCEPEREGSETAPAEFASMSAFSPSFCRSAATNAGRHDLAAAAAVQLRT